MRIFSLLVYQSIMSLALWILAALAPVLSRFPGRVQEGFHHYFGLLPKADPRPLIWIHGVSLGESLVACALAAEIKREYPGLQIGFSSTHPDVIKLVRRKNLADQVAFFPLDYWPFWLRALRRWHPQLILLAETDFWPLFSFLCHLRRIPLGLINGRISDKIRAFYTSLPLVGRPLFSSFAFLAVQTPADRERLLAMGANSQNIQVLGNIKIDLVQPPDIKNQQPVRDWLGTDSLVIFGSLHPSEFQGLMPLFTNLLRPFSPHPGESLATPNSHTPPTQDSHPRILIAPRNIDHARLWRQTLADAGMAAELRTSLSPASSARVLLLDTIGELAGLYSLATLAVIGGTFDPLVGGHNPIEALQFGVPVVVGPHYRNFADLVTDLEEAGGISICRATAETQNLIPALLADSVSRHDLASRAATVLARHRGALRQTLNLLSPYLRKKNTTTRPPLAGLKYQS